jgi:hypothetical protein
MKTILSFLLIISQYNHVLAQTTAIPDTNFEQALIDLGYDFGTPDGTVITATIDTVVILNLLNDGISDLSGIEDFTALKELNCAGNYLTSINLSQNSALNILSCNGNQLTSLNVAQNTDLVTLSCFQNQLTSLDVSQNVKLNLLNCRNNQIASLDVSHNTSLTALFCSSNPVSTLDLSQNDSLVYLDCSSNQLSNLDVSQNLDLTFLRCSDNLIGSIDLSQNILLTDLYCEQNQLTDLEVTQNDQLAVLHCFSNQLACLNVKNGNNVNIFPNALDARNNPALTCIEVDNPSWSAANWPHVDFSVSFKLNCDLCTVGINENNSPKFDCYPNPTSGNITIDLGAGFENIKVKLINRLGQVISSKNFVSCKHFNIDIDAPPGIYTLLIETGNGKANSIRVLKK